MIPTRLRKVLGDLTQRWGRTLLTLAGLSMGLFGLCSVVVALVMMLGDLDAGFRATLPPNITVSTDPVDAVTLARLRAIPGVVAVEQRPMIAARLETAQNRWTPLILFVVDDFQHMEVARFDRDEGAWPPPAGTLLIERNGRFFAPAPLGTTYKVRLPAGPDVEAVLSGVAYDPGQAQSRVEGVIYGYVSRATVQAWGYPIDRSRVLIRTSDRPRQESLGDAFYRQLLALHGMKRTPPRPPVYGVAETVQATLEAAGLAVRDVQAVARPQHPHQFQLDSIIALLLGVAAVSFVMCAVLVANLIDSIMTAEQRAIGVMKALGADSGQIARDYLLSMALLGLLAAGITAPMALKAGKGMAEIIAMMLNFKLTTDGGPTALIVILAMGVGLPVLVAARRILGAARRPVREALSRSGVVRNSLFADGFGLLSGVLPLIPRMAARTLARRPGRTLFTALILSLGLTFFVTALNLKASLYETVEAVSRTKPHDLSVIFRDPILAGELQTFGERLPNVRKVELWSVTPGALSPGRPTRINPLPVFAVPAVSAALRPDVIGGHWVDPSRPEEIAVTQRVLSQRADLKLGGVYVLSLGRESAPVRIAGVVKEFGPGGIYVSDRLFERLAPRGGKANLMFVTLKQSSFRAQRKAARKLEEAVVGTGWQVANVTTTGQTQAIVESHLIVIAVMLQFIAGLAVIVGALGLASAIGVSVVERYRAIGVLKTVGGRAGAVASLFASEAVMVGVLAWGMALAAAPWLSRALSAAFGSLIVQYPFDYRPDPWAAPAALGVAVAVALAASLLPIRSALTMTIHRALRSE